MKNKTEWKTIKSSTGTSIRIYTRNCNFCQNYYEGRGAKFCSRSCSTKWGRKNKDYSKARFRTGKNNPNGNGLSEERIKNLSCIMKQKWADGKFSGTTFSSKETNLEKITRTTIENLGLEFKTKFWLNKKGWKAKEYDFYIPSLNLLIEVDGKYWHSLPENIENDKYKNRFAEFMGYKLMRIPECLVKEDAVRAAIKDYQDKKE